MKPAISNSNIVHIAPNSTFFFRLLRLLGRSRILDRLAIHPQCSESHESRHCSADSSNPGPRAGDDVASGPLVVGNVSDADSGLLLNVGEEGALVVDLEVEDAVLVGEGEGCVEDGGGLGCGGRIEIEAVEGGEHGEFELEGVLVGKCEGNPLVPDVLGDGDAVALLLCQ